jgi:hypothetical protein
MLEVTQQAINGPASIGPTPGLGPLVRRTGRASTASPDVESWPIELAAVANIDTSPAPFDLQNDLPSVAKATDFNASSVATTVESHIVSLASPVSAAVPVSAGESADRQITVEELIDLEQQVDFFVVLGQDDAATDLLQSRISTGHANALPFLKLLELHQRRGDAVAFSDLAAEFGARFGALPPSWGTNLNQGRSLESYDSAMQGLLSGWDDSGHSMALLQSLLARGTGHANTGGDGARGFDLPAYRDLLMLYSVARDRAEQDLRGDEVDVLLPLDEAGDEGAGMVSTMVWQVQPTLLTQSSDELDISLDDEPITRP